MGNRTKLIEDLRLKWVQVSPYLDERSKRILAGAESQAIGVGGKAIVHEATGLDWKTISKGEQEIASRSASEDDVSKSIRRSGGGRKQKTKQIPSLEERLEALVEPHTKGDPVRPLHWTSKSTYKLSEELKREGISVSPNTIGSILANLDYSLQLMGCYL